MGSINPTVLLQYKVFHQLAEWGLVALDLVCCPAVQPFLPKSHLPKHNWADRGAAKIKVDQTKVFNLIELPVHISRPSQVAKMNCQGLREYLVRSSACHSRNHGHFILTQLFRTFENEGAKICILTKFFELLSDGLPVGGGAVVPIADVLGHGPRRPRCHRCWLHPCLL